MKLSKFFYKSDLLTSDYSDTTKKQQYLFQRLMTKLGTSYTVKSDDGLSTKTITIDFFGTTSDNGWRKFEREYFHNFSGNKIISAICDEISEDEDFWDTDDLTTYRSYIDMLADDIVAKYGDNWKRLWYAVNIMYNPTWNVDGTTKDIPQDNYKITTANNGWNASKSGSVTTTSAQDTYGFNSSTGVDKDASTATSTPNHDVTATNSNIPGNQDSIGEQANQSVTSQTGYIENVRGGNIGVTMTQQLLDAEFSYRLKYNFYNIVYKNIDEILTCSCYGTAGEDLED